MDVSKGELAIPEVNETLKLAPSNFVTLTTLYEDMREFLRVTHDQFGNLWKSMQRTQNSGQKQEISSEDVLKWSTSRTLLEEDLDVGIVGLVFLCNFFTIPTTLYEDQEVHTCMTSIMKSGQCVGIGYMFKNRTFWNFQCIIRWHMHTCIVCYLGDAEFQETL